MRSIRSDALHEPRTRLVGKSLWGLTKVTQLLGVIDNKLILLFGPLYQQVAHYKDTLSSAHDINKRPTPKRLSLLQHHHTPKPLSQNSQNVRGLVHV